MKLFFKFLLKHIVRFFLHIFWIFSVNERKVYFSSFDGKQFSCNPKYLYLFLLKSCGSEFQYVWEFTDIRKYAFESNALCVKRHSAKAFFHILTSKYIFTNVDFSWSIPLRKKQILIETWHGGGAYKTVGLGLAKSLRLFDIQQKRISRQIAFYVSSSQKFTLVQSESKNVSVEKFIPTGMPRNELFFHPDFVQKQKERVLAQYDIDSTKRVVLYAPTYRGGSGGFSKKENVGSEYGTMNFSSLVQTLKEKDGKDWIVLFRGHHLDSDSELFLPSFVLDATRYEDMQELLCAADVLITDYSSCMWDFALTKKPCFLYAPDLAQYIAERGFYTDPHTWPFPLAQSEEELWQNIRAFDAERYAAAVQQHLDDFGSYENADSCRKVCEAVGIM